MSSFLEVVSTSIKYAGSSVCLSFVASVGRYREFEAG
jgi:hypothetical protein